MLFQLVKRIDKNLQPAIGNKRDAKIKGYAVCQTMLDLSQKGSARSFRIGDKPRLLSRPKRVLLRIIRCLLNHEKTNLEVSAGPRISD